MSNELAYLAQMRGDLQYLKALCGRIAGSSAASTPSADFCCDMFDRPDSDSLGAYWGDTTGAWSLYGGVALSRSGTAYQAIPTSNAALTSIPTLAAAKTGFTGAIGFIPTSGSASQAIAIGTVALRANVAFRGTHQTCTQNMYGASMTSPDMIVKITFTARKSPVASSAYALGTISIAWNAYAPTVFGAAFGNAAGQNIGVAGGFCAAPAQANSGGSWAGSDGVSSFSGGMPAAATAPFELMQMEFGNFGSAATMRTPTVSLTQDPGNVALVVGTGQLFYESGVNYDAFASFNGATSGAAGVSSPSGYAGASSPLINGLNTLTMQVRGTTYVCDINGTVFVNQTSPLVLGRTKVGLAGYAYDLFTAATSYGYTGVGIKSFKAWRGDIPEPLDQSGHGTYSATTGLATYSDKYHTTDSSGTVTYNPLA